MNSSGHRIPNGETPAGGFPRVSVGKPGNGERPPCLPGRHHRIHGVRGLPRNAPAKAPGGTFSMWARAPCAPRPLCG